MKYFGIQTPAREHQSSYIWWIANTVHNAWLAFFNYPTSVGEMNAMHHRTEEAIRAYEAIGYECVELSVTVAGEDDSAEKESGAVAEAIAAEREECAKVCDELAAMLPGTKTGNTMELASSKIRQRGTPNENVVDG